MRLASSHAVPLEKRYLIAAGSLTQCFVAGTPDGGHAEVLD
jgi:hypothetical protein